MPLYENEFALEFISQRQRETITQLVIKGINVPGKNMCTPSMYKIKPTWNSLDEHLRKNKACKKIVSSN